MDSTTRKFILDIMENANDMTLATVREDGYPQATTVSYANDGLTLYFATAKDSQKAKNIGRCDKVSLTIDTPYKDWSDIRGLSMGASAQVVRDPKEIEHALRRIIEKFPQAANWMGGDAKADLVVLRIEPRVISILDYTKGFGHTDLVTV